MQRGYPWQIFQKPSILTLIFMVNLGRFLAIYCRKGWGKKLDRTENVLWDRFFEKFFKVLRSQFREIRDLERSEILASRLPYKCVAIVLRGDREVREFRDFARKFSSWFSARFTKKSWTIPRDFFYDLSRAVVKLSKSYFEAYLF